jgi:hypothetical protein
VVLALWGALDTYALYVLAARPEAGLLGIPSAAGLIQAIDLVAAVVSVPLFLAAMASLLLRFRRAAGWSASS